MYEKQTAKLIDVIAETIQEEADIEDEGFAHSIAYGIYSAIHKELTTPYLDKDHQGGNLLDLLFQYVKQNYKLNERIKELENNV